MAKFNQRDLSRILTRTAGDKGTPTSSPGYVNSWYNETIPPAVAINVSFATTAAAILPLHMNVAVRCRYVTVLGGASGRQVEARIFRGTPLNPDVGTIQLTAMTQAVYGLQNTKYDSGGSSTYMYVFDFGSELLLNPYSDMYFIGFKSRSSTNFSMYMADCVFSPVGIVSVTDNESTLKNIYTFEYTGGLRCPFIGMYSTLGYNMFMR